MRPSDIFFMSAFDFMNRGPLLEQLWVRTLHGPGPPQGVQTHSHLSNLWREHSPRPFGWVRLLEVTSKLVTFVIKDLS